MPEKKLPIELTSAVADTKLMLYHYFFTKENANPNTIRAERVQI